MVVVVIVVDVAAAAAAAKKTDLKTLSASLLAFNFFILLLTLVDVY